MTGRHLLVAALVAAACGRDRTPAAGENAPGAAVSGQQVVEIEERYITPFDSLDNIDSPAVYHAGDVHWLLATAKSTDVIVVYDALTGAQVRRVGREGRQPGELDRPNGIVVADSLLLVVERDNARVQAFRLPSFASVGTFGEGTLRRPYGIALSRGAPSDWTVWVTDNYETPDGATPPDRELGARVKAFRVIDRGATVESRLLQAFGDTVGEGVLRTVESILADPPAGRLLVAEETETDSHIKVYELDGRFSGQVFGRGFFPQQAEGIALYACDDSAGYWIITDQGDATNTFHVFDRVSFDHLGAFTGRTTRRTDGVALTQVPFGPFPAGAFFAVHLDASVAAFSWADIARALGLRSDCHR